MLESCFTIRVGNKFSNIEYIRKYHGLHGNAVKLISKTGLYITGLVLY